MKNHSGLLACLLLVLSCSLAQAADEPQRSVNVSADAEVMAAPDMARLTLSVVETDKDMGAVQDKTNAVVRDFVAAAVKLGIDKKDIATTAVQLQPDYEWDQQNKRNVQIGYRSTRSIDLTVRDLARLGDVFKAATAAGINHVQAPRMDASRADELRDQAMVKATLEARRKADLLAGTLGMKLGDVLTISAEESAGSAPVRPVMMAKAAMADSANQDMGIEAGEIRFNATVSASFALQSK